MYRKLEFAVCGNLEIRRRTPDCSAFIEQRFDHFGDKQANIQTQPPHLARTYDSIVYPGRVASVAR